jgi:hypothetical protein
MTNTTTVADPADVDAARMVTWDQVVAARRQAATAPGPLPGNAEQAAAAAADAGVPQDVLRAAVAAELERIAAEAAAGDPGPSQTPPGA